jgi:FMN reductase
MSDRSEVVIVVGNPQPGSRTAGIGRRVGERVAEVASLDGVATIDLADQPEGLLRWKDPTVAGWRDLVLQARLLVVASPTYKASFTGLVKLFLDAFGHDALAGLTTVAVMTGGSADHSLAVQHHLVPVLVEIGASCPTRGLYVSGAAVDDPEPLIDAWLTTAGPVLARALRG